MDTEVLVDAALRVLVGRKMNARILDLCSGSGCIGCALAHELPAARVVMVDISDAALAVSKENLRRNRQNRTICLKADALEKPPMSIGTFDIIVSNPPYVASMDILTLDSSVRDYEPLGALDAFTRMNMQDEILNIWREQKQTVVMVTHDVEEAIYMGTRVLVMEPRPGRVKADIPIELAEPKQRDSEEFQAYRNRILKMLDLKHHTDY